MTSVEKQKALLREKLKSFKEGTDYNVSSEFDVGGEVKTYTVYSPKLKKDLRQILSSIRNWENDEDFVYKIKESSSSISVSRSLTVDSSSGEKEWEKFGEIFKKNGNAEVGSPKIKELTDQEAQQIEQQRPFFLKPKGN